MPSKDKILFSIIIPTYNHGRYIGRAIKSVIEQTYPNWEAIIIDNHSEDDTENIVNSLRDSRIKFLKIHNKGIIARSRNRGIQEARGQWIAFLDSDDWWTSNKLQVCFDRIDDHVDLLYHKLTIIREVPSSFSRKSINCWQVKKPVIIDLLVKSNPITNSSVVVRQSILIQIEGMEEDPKMIASEDYNTWLRIAQITDYFVFIPQELGFYFIHKSSISQKDTTLQTRYASREFFPLLNNKQKVLFECNLRYENGKFALLDRNYGLARQNFIFCIRKGDFLNRLKSIVMFTKSLI